MFGKAFNAVCYDTAFYLDMLRCQHKLEPGQIPDTVTDRQTDRSPPRHCEIYPVKMLRQIIKKKLNKFILTGQAAITLVESMFWKRPVLPGAHPGFSQGEGPSRNHHN